MPKLSWNDFVETHDMTARIAFGISLHGFPTGPVFDRAKKRVPTPYVLIRDWLAETLTDDWATMKDGREVIILVATSSDAALVLKKFPAIDKVAKSKIADKSVPVALHAETFVDLATTAGFTPPFAARGRA